jgi:integrase
LQTRAARDRLNAGAAPHWRTITPKLLHLGYRRRRKGKPGYWLVRRYLGLDAGGVGRYQTTTLGLADDFQDADGEHVLSFADAQRLAQAAQPHVRRGALTVAEALERYVAWMRSEGKATADEVARRAARLILPQLGTVRVSELTTEQLNRWRDAMATSPALLRTANGATQNFRPTPDTDEGRRVRRSTANKLVTIVKAALNHAFKEGLVHDDKEWRKFKPFSNVDAARPGYLNVEQAQRLINAADRESGFRDVVHAALLTGCRYGELCRLRVADFADGKIAIRRSKTGKPRDVRLTDEGVTFFEQLTAGREGEETMLVNRRLGREWRKSEQARPMRAACERAKIKPLGFHQLRHTWASLAVMNGVPLIVVAHNLGHKDTRMVEKHYGHLSESYMDEAIRNGAPRFGAVEKTGVALMRRTGKSQLASQ